MVWFAPRFRPGGPCWVALAALCLLGLSSAVATRVALAEPENQHPVVVLPPPDGFDAKPPLEPGDLRRKKEQSYVTGLPLANLDPNTGVGGGVRVYYYFNGDRDDPFFAYTPYLHRVFLQAFFTSKGLQFHWLDYDGPAIAGTPYRLRSQLILLRNTEQHFFGAGNDSLAPLTFTGAGRDFDSYAAYQQALRAVRPDGSALTHYNDYDILRPLWYVSVERTFLHGLLRPLVGLGFSYARIADYTGKTVPADGPDGAVDAVMGPTLFREQCDRGQLVGCDGGWDNIVRLGLSFDTRDFEPDPNSGVFIDTALDLGTTLLGSQFTHARFLLSARYYHSILPRLTDLVFAVRGTFQAQSAGTPVSSLDIIPWTEDSRSGLGGLRTLRGFRQDRFIGRYFTLVNLELRWTFHRFEVLSQKLGTSLGVFLDTGRVYDRLDDLTLRDWRHGQGLGVRISWNQATIIVFDYGLSSEDSGLYINFSHQF